ncbi:MAG: ABC transporter permease [Candidatus Hodarchaeota archaeon]
MKPIKKLMLSPWTQVVLKKTGRFVVILFTLIAITWVLMYYAPGDPIRIKLGPFATEEMVELMRERYGLNDPIEVQFFRFIIGLTRGDLGTSYINDRPVWIDIRAALPHTLLLASTAMIISLVLGIPMGIYSAVRQGSISDRVFMVIALYGASVPAFLTGMVIMFILGYKLRLLPCFGAGSIQHLIMPGLTLALFVVGMIARITRTSMLDVMHQNYIRTARAKGLLERTVLYRHALRNALIPLITVAGLQFGMLLGGSVITETVFAYPGMGRLLVNAILLRDRVMTLGCIIVYALLFMVVNTALDILYPVIDPRIKLKI